MSFWQLLIVFGIVILVFGTSRLKSIGGDLGTAIKGFRRSMDGDDDNRSRPASESAEAKRIEIESKPDVGMSEQASFQKRS